MISNDPYFQQDFPAEEFAARRARIFHEIGGEAVAVLPGAPATGAFDYFRQTNDFYYLCGVEVPHAYVLLDGRSRTSTLYLPPHDPKHERSEGKQLHADDPATAIRLTGIEHIAVREQLALDLARAKTVFTPYAPAEGREACHDTLRYAKAESEADPWHRRPSPEEHFRARLASVIPGLDFRDLSPIVANMRLCKSFREIALMRRAGEITAQAVVEAMQRTRADMIEYQLAAVADFVFNDRGAKGPGYRAIVASGANIWNAHYFRNNAPLRDGELVLMDYAPDLGNYTSDIGRMWPVSGRYSPVQRELYGFVVAYHQVLLEVIRPGIGVSELAREAAGRSMPRLESWPFSKPAYREAARKMIDSPVAFTHPVGMAVHDVGEYRGAPLSPGLVLALDPQLWVPEEQLYLRVEDTVAVTENGVESLTAGAPLDLSEVEAVVGTRS